MADADDNDDVITTEDVAWLNGRVVARSARNARLVGSVLIAVGVVGVVLNLWLNWRYQDRLEADSPTELTSSLGPPQDPDVSLGDRLDLFAQLYSLVVPVMAIGLGLGLQLVADYAVARTGGSLGTVAVGDRVPMGPDDEDDDSGTGDPGDREPVLPPDPGGYEPRA
jgi:hypothetical protein